MSKLTSLSKLPSENRELVKMQENMQQVVAPLTQSPMLNNILLENIVLRVGDNSIAHKLLRKPRGYWIVSNSGVSNFYDNIVTGGATKLAFNLNSSAAITVSIYVF